MKIKTAQDIRQLGTILAVWAHPDDESFLAAGILTTAVKNGQKVICVTATKGEAGNTNQAKWPKTSLAEIRTIELKNALKELGITEHHWLDYADGCCCDVAEKDGCRCLMAYIEQYQPDSIMTFGPEGWTGHKDHITVSRWVDLAVAQSSFKPVVYHAVITAAIYDGYLKAADQKVNIFFNIDKPPIIDRTDCAIYFELSPEAIETKRRALAAMPSQTEVLLSSFDKDFFAKAFGTECYVRAK